MPFDPTLDPLADLPQSAELAERPPGSTSIVELLAQARQKADGTVRPCRECGGLLRIKVKGELVCGHCRK